MPDNEQPSALTLNLGELLDNYVQQALEDTDCAVFLGIEAERALRGGSSQAGLYLVRALLSVLVGAHVNLKEAFGPALAEWKSDQASARFPSNINLRFED